MHYLKRIVLLMQSNYNILRYKTYCTKNHEKLRNASFVKEDSLSLKVTKLVQKLSANFRIKTKHDLVLFTQQLFTKNKFILNKPSLLLTCEKFLKLFVAFLYIKPNIGVFTLNNLNLIIKNIKSSNYKFSALEAASLPKAQIKVNSKADIKKWRKNLTGLKLKTFNSILKNKRFKLSKSYVINNCFVYNSNNLKDKLIELCCNTIFISLIGTKKIFPNELYSYWPENNLLNFQYNWKKISFTLKFINKLDLLDFFSNLKKKIAVLALSQVIPKSDILMYSLLKKLFFRGYCLKIVKFSKSIGAKNVSIKTNNVDVFKVYQGTMVSRILSNLVNFLIIKKLKIVLKNFNMGKKSTKNKIKMQFSTKLYQEKNKKKFDNKKIQFYKKKIRQWNPVSFSNIFKRARIFVYYDRILIVTHLSNKENLNLINKIKNEYYNFGFNFNKAQITFCFYNSKGLSFLGFFLRSYKTTSKHKNNLIKFNCNLEIDTIKIKKKFDVLGVLKDRNLLTGKRDRKKELKNKITQRNNLYFLNKREIKIRNKLICDPKYKVLALLPLITLNLKNIIVFFYYKMLCLKNYYKYCKYTNYLSYFLWVLKMSCYKTLCAKFKINTIKNLFKKFGSNLEKLAITEWVVKLRVVSKKKLFKKLIKEYKHKFGLTYENFNKQVLQIQATTQFYMEKLFCSICGSTVHLELHHVKNILKIHLQILKLKFKYKNLKFLEHNVVDIFKLVHTVKKRKQIVICFNCHVKIYNKTLEKKYLDKFIKLL